MTKLQYCELRSASSHVHSTSRRADTEQSSNYDLPMLLYFCHLSDYIASLLFYILRPVDRYQLSKCEKYDLEANVLADIHGIALTKEAWASLPSLFVINLLINPVYFYEIMKASIFGLVDGSTEDSFDLIDTPPKYEQNALTTG